MTIYMKLCDYIVQLHQHTATIQSVLLLYLLQHTPPHSVSCHKCVKCLKIPRQRKHKNTIPFRCTPACFLSNQQLHIRAYSLPMSSKYIQSESCNPTPQSIYVNFLLKGPTGSTGPVWKTFYQESCPQGTAQSASPPSLWRSSCANKVIKTY